MKSKHILLLLLVCLTMCTRKNLTETIQSNPDVSESVASSSDSLWEPFPGNDSITRALPDWYSNYYAFSFDRRKADNKYIGVRIKGEYGYARYMSFNLYDGSVGTTFGAYTDTALIPDDGNDNPFKVNAAFYGTKRNYTLTVVPKNYAVNNATNIFTYNSDSINVLCVMIRYYVPQNSPTAGFPLPQIEAFDVRTGETVDIPETYSLAENGQPLYKYTLGMARIWQTSVDDTVRFYRVAGSGEFNNADNIYLISALKRFKERVFVIRFKSPTFRHDSTTEGNTNVRYWSINEGKYNTTTPFGLKDAEFKQAKDGFVYIVVADDDPLIRDKAEAGGYNFMKWSVGNPIMALLYRNMLGDPSYPGYLGKVDTLGTSDPQRIYNRNARNYIGDYAPQGLRMKRGAFLKNYGGWPSPGF